MQAIYLIGEAE